jgi:AraC-like DNA-binding protein/ABC-type Fe3+-citrate transport system substrate-binding protein
MYLSFRIIDNNSHCWYNRADKYQGEGYSMSRKGEDRGDKGNEAGVREKAIGLSLARSYIEQHYNQPITVGELANIAGLSRNYFVDLFSKTYGQGAIGYLNDLRIAQAKRYLAEGGYRLKEIARLVGYSDEFYFSRKFKKEVGVSPSAYINKPPCKWAACSPSIMGQLLPLGIMPFAAPLDPKWTPYYYNEHKEAVAYHMPFGCKMSDSELARLARMHLDGIIGYERMAGEQKSCLQQLAPSFFVNELDPWQLQLRQIADFAGAEREAETWLRRHEEKLDQVRKSLSKKEFRESFLVLRVYRKQLYAYCNRSIRELLYDKLQLTQVFESSGVYNRPLTVRQLAAINPDRLLVLVCPETESRMYWLALQHQREWKGLASVASGRMHPIPSDPWCQYSASAIDRMLDELQLLVTGFCPNEMMNLSHGEA